MTFLAVVVVDVICVFIFLAAAFDEAMSAWAGAYARNPHSAGRQTSTALAVVAVVLGLFAFYLLRIGSEAAGLSQVLLAVIAALVAWSGFSSGDSESGPTNPMRPAATAPSASSSGSPVGRTFCYSGGSCVVNGTPVSGAP